jgi:hypothetical protein
MPEFRFISFMTRRQFRLLFRLLSVLAALLIDTPLLAQTAPSSLVPFRRGNRWGYADHKRHPVLPLAYDEAGPFVNEVAWIRQGTLFGYIDGGGNPVTPVQYTRASNFSQGRAHVELHGEIFDIDSNGQRLDILSDSEPETDYLQQGDIVRRQGKVGFRFTAGSNTIVPTEYDEIQDLHHDGLLAVLQSTKWGVLNAKGKLVLPLAYDAIRATATNAFAYPIVEQAGRFGYLDNEGKLMIQVKYNTAEPFIGEVARVTTPEGKTGYIDSRGQEYFEE